jgi:MoaA/NifB/PqqE/SkfB family radical SAM enzyme
MNIPHNKFCVLPWVSLETSPIGTVRPCCLADDEILDDFGNKCRLDTHDFDTIRNTYHMRQLREQFILGQQPETCRKCWQEESAGRTSKRMHTLDRLKHMLTDEPWNTHARPLMFLDLKLGNICNLKCRICGSWSSSTFATEELQHVADKKKSFHYEMLQQGAWPRQNTQFWRELDLVMPQIRYIEFTGGEPFMIQEHFDLLQKLVDTGQAQQVEIHYNTNGTQYPEQAELIWQHFKTVEIAFSIDDVGARFEYQRKNAVWTQVEQNINRFRAMRNAHNNIQLQVCSTVNVFNVLYLADLAQWIDQQDFDFVYWNMLHDAPYLSIASLPNAVKQAAAERLRTALVGTQHRTEFDRMIDFMINGASTDGNELKAHIQRLDQRRQENLTKVQPELALLLNYE